MVAQGTKQNQPKTLTRHAMIQKPAKKEDLEKVSRMSEFCNVGVWR